MSSVSDQRGNNAWSHRGTRVFACSPGAGANGGAGADGGAGAGAGAGTGAGASAGAGKGPGAGTSICRDAGVTVPQSTSSQATAPGPPPHISFTLLQTTFHTNGTHLQISSPFFICFTNVTNRFFNRFKNLIISTTARKMSSPCSQQAELSMLCASPNKRERASDGDGDRNDHDGKSDYGEGDGHDDGHDDGGGDKSNHADGDGRNEGHDDVDGDGDDDDDSPSQDQNLETAKVRHKGKEPSSTCRVPFLLDVLALY